MSHTITELQLLTFVVNNQCICITEIKNCIKSTFIYCILLLLQVIDTKQKQNIVDCNTVILDTGTVTNLALRACNSVTRSLVAKHAYVTNIFKLERYRHSSMGTIPVNSYT